MSVQAIPSGPIPPAERLMTSNEVAAICRCTPATVRDWRLTGRLSRSVRVGGRWLFAESDVLALISPPSNEEMR